MTQLQDAETIFVTGAAPFTAQQLLELDACTRCGRCIEACGSFRATGDEGTAIMGMIQRRRRLFRSEGSLLERLFGPRDPAAAWDQYQRSLFNCTLCGRCQQVCPVGIRTRDLALSMRQELASSRCMMPKNLGLARDALRDEHNVFGFPNEERAFWAEFLDDLPDDLFTKERCEVLYYVGCVSSFSPAVQEIPQAFLRLLLKAGVDIGMLAGREWCCGFPLIIGGLREEADALIRHNIEEGIERMGAKTVVFNCPSCYYTWRKYYPLQGVRLMHAAEFVQELVREGKLTFRPTDKTITYHDPCDLGRGLGIFDPPRNVLSSIPDAEFIELTPSREMALCCGGGGDVEMWAPDVVQGVSDNLVDAVEKSGAQLLVQACPQCKRTTRRGLDNRKSSVETMDIVEFALEFGVFPKTEGERETDGAGR